MRNDRVVSDGNAGSDIQAIAVSVIDQNEPGPGNLVAAINIGGGTYTAVESGISRSLATSKKIIPLPILSRSVIPTPL
jgi:hypothetical protein